MNANHESWKGFINNRREEHILSQDEANLIDLIKKETTKFNADNISRTIAYQDYFFRLNEVEWSFLASMVSRNAGYNMTDLANPIFMNGLSEKQRKQLFITYERANWIIFLDAFPQLLLFEYSKMNNKPLFYLLKYFSVSTFMEIEWEKYWTDRDKKRLVYSLIINEQNMIERPVIQNKFFKNEVFNTIAFKLQEQLKLSYVIFPTNSGELYGLAVYQFEDLTKRIQIGRQLYSILFHQDLNNGFINFAKQTNHTGSRSDYESLVGIANSSNPKLRDVYPIIPHKRSVEDDWYSNSKILTEWYENEEIINGDSFKESFLIKQELLSSLLKLKGLFQ
ncbi:DUF2515 family protein [Bacillus sp. AFS017336]|uniref:DUF2515 family protein n=1 Tax=Bacillus sp. AFS017336 TaxID=2033489 RepID=UPI000BF18A1D|nr:DUF2515 family protein [Bacillus sp. AFS017336]PEL11706.1 hypothetical protein CN601_09865 [Bacillus sp. AFS017336]